MKTLKFIIFPFICIILISLLSPVYAQEDILNKLESIAIVKQKIMIPMRDGVRLATDVYRPKTDESVPIIFSRTPYNFNYWSRDDMKSYTFHMAHKVVKQGYAFVVQNERGRYFSEGEWEILGAPRTDGYDAIKWMSEQPWSNGKVGLIGCSSTAEWQMAVAAMDPPGLAAVVPMGYGAGIGRVGEFHEQGNWYRGGVHQMLMTAWLYDYGFIQTCKWKPMFPSDIPREDLVTMSRYFDLAPHIAEVDWSEELWHLPLIDIMNNLNAPESKWEGMLKRKPNDPAWYEGGLYHDDMPCTVPGLWLISWYDISVSPNLALYNHVRKNAEDPDVAENQFAVVSPVTHCAFGSETETTVIGERNVGDARYDYDALVYGWFDYWLKGEDNDFVKKTPKVQYYTMGLNKWQSSDTWPPENAEIVTLYLTSRGNANSVFGDGKLTTDPPDSKNNPDMFIYDPACPVPLHGGGFCCLGSEYQAGSFDQRQLETRHDILVYSTDPLKKGVEITGPVEITLYISSDVKDTDFTVKLIDVYPDGSAYNIDETIQRVRYREGYDKEVFMEEGEVYKLPVSSMSTSNYFAPGHRIRIEISSSNFPRFARNLNTGGNNYDETDWVVAHNNVHHSAEYPSQIRVSVVDWSKDSID